MKSKKIIVAALVAVAAIVLAGCSPRSSMATLSTDSDSETAEVFSLAKVLNLGTNYLTSLDYDNAILQYIDIIQHDPTNKEAYAGLYAAYAAQGKADEANKVFEQAQEVFDDEADFLPGFLDDAKLVFESGGGNVPFQMLSEHFWNDLNSVFAKDVGEAWIAADPQNADPYALLDMRFLSAADPYGRAEEILHMIITMGNHMKLSIIAEGVETEQQKVMLQGFGCNKAQGYFYARPMREAEYTELLKKEKAEN